MGASNGRFSAAGELDFSLKWQARSPEAVASAADSSGATVCKGLGLAQAPASASSA